MELSAPNLLTDKLVRHYSERREADIVLRVQFRQESAGGCRVFFLCSVEELTN